MKFKKDFKKLNNTAYEILELSLNSPILGVCTPLVSSCYLVPALTHILLNPACTLAISERVLSFSFLSLKA